ncbi:Histone deacetylase 8 [Phlyctochytrium bullatum]|nr:Histone deacetylase 8 [Phlyctochytrium bullatum]
MPLSTILSDLVDNMGDDFLTTTPDRTAVTYIVSGSYARIADQLPSNPGRTNVHLNTDSSTRLVPPRPATLQELLAYHDEEYIRALLAAEKWDDDDSDVMDALEAMGLTDDCQVFPGLAEYVRWTAGASLTAARELVEGRADVAIHWDGGRHHAERDRASGFCYVNDVVLSIMELHRAFPKVLYIDIDIHHCDGVESAFAYSSKVLRLSFHLREPGFFPGTGSPSDTGRGTRGRGHAVNVVLERGLTRQTLVKAFREAVVEGAGMAYRPDAVVMQCGVDGMWGDAVVGGAAHGVGGGGVVGLEEMGVTEEMVEAARKALDAAVKSGGVSEAGETFGGEVPDGPTVKWLKPEAATIGSERQGECERPAEESADSVGGMAGVPSSTTNEPPMKRQRENDGEDGHTADSTAAGRFSSPPDAPKPCDETTPNTPVSDHADLPDPPLGWNLDAASAAECLQCVLDELVPALESTPSSAGPRRVPVLVLGGGGYTSALAARAWCLATLGAVGGCAGWWEDSDEGGSGTKRKRGGGSMGVEVEVPEHPFFHLYGPDFMLWRRCRGERGFMTGPVADLNRGRV